MAICLVIGGQMFPLQRHRLAIEKAEDIMQRPHPAGGIGAPFHWLRPGQRGNGRIQQLRQHGNGGASLCLDHRIIKASFVGFPLFKLIMGETGAFQEAFNCLLRRADTGTTTLLERIKLRCGQPIDHNSKTPGRGKSIQPVKIKSRGFESFSHQPREIIGGLVLHTRRDFLGE